MTTPTELLRQAMEELDLSQALLEKSQHHPRILAVYKALRAHLYSGGEVQEPAVPQWLPIEPTQGMITAMSTSKAKDSEGEFPMLLDLIDYSGENKTYTVLTAAYPAMLATVPTPKHPCTWPTCKSEAYQDALATQVHAELIGQEPAVPPGYVLVPIEPTSEMCAQAWGTCGTNKNVNKAIYAAMLAAASTPKEPT